MSLLSALFYADQWLNLILAGICWWLAHQEALRKPPGIVVAAGYVLIGTGTMALVLNVEHPVLEEVLRVLIKIGMIITFFAVANRHMRVLRHQMEPGT